MKDFYVSKSIIEGFGCFANRTFLIGEIIRIPIILVPREPFNKYMFPWDREYCSIVLSEISYCNSSIDNNIKILSICKDSLTKSFIVTKNINIGDEIFLTYLKEHLKPKK